MTDRKTSSPSSPSPRPSFGEFDLIARYFKPLVANNPDAFDLADDAALLASDSTGLVVTKDVIVEGIHFLEDTPADLIAQKALRVNLSDLAAKGAVPLGYMMGLGLRSDPDPSWMTSFAEGLAKDQDEFGLKLFGGDTVVSPERLFLSITMFGHAPKGGMVKRAGAAPGDRIYVTGTIGDGFLGLQAARGRLSDLSAKHLAALQGRYNRPCPRNAASDVLARHASAAMDISDGLIADLGHLMSANNCGAHLEIDKIPVSDGAQAVLDEEHYARIDLACGGDDYELLFTVRKPADIEGEFAKCGVAVSCVGEMTDGSELTITDDLGAQIAPPKKGSGYDHFA